MGDKLKVVNQALITGILLMILVGGGLGILEMKKRLGVVDEILAKFNITLLQVASTAQTLQATTKSFQEQFDDPKTIQTRKSGLS